MSATGYIYIMTNPALSGMVKIGYAKDVEARRQQLSTTALPYEYEIYATYETSGKLEDKQLHKLIDNLNPDLRVSKNREFFVMTADEAYELLAAIAIISGTPHKLKRKQGTVNVAAEENAQKIKKPVINFVKCGIPIGSVLTYTEDPSITVTVASERKVQYGEELTSLSAVVERCKGWKSAQGSVYFTYKGKIIADIAKETQWREGIAPEPVLKSYTAEPVAQKKTRATRHTFKGRGIPVGALLTFTKDQSKQVTVLNEDNLVLCDGKELKLSPAANYLLGRKNASGPEYFMYNGVKLADIDKQA